MADIKLLGRLYYNQIKQQSKADIFNLCEQLWQSGYLEEGFIACDWAWRLKKKYTPDDLKLFKKWINQYVNNWATCDTFCNHVVGDFVMMYPEYITEIKSWTKSKNRWMRRAAAVSLIAPARKGMFLKEMIEIATILLTDNEDIVQKGYGWMLKVASQTYQQEVFNFVLQHKEVMPRTALRYAIEKMPESLRKQAMQR